MALKYKMLENNEGIAIDDNGLPVVFDDEKEDEKEFGLNAIHLYTKIPALNAEAQKHREAKEEMKKKLEEYAGLDVKEIKEKLDSFAGIDPIKAKKALETVANLDHVGKEQGIKVEEIKAEAAIAWKLQIEELKDTFANKLNDVSKVVEKKDSAIRNLLVKGAFDRSEFIKNHTVVPSEMAYNTFGSHFKIEEDQKVFAVNSQGKTIYSVSKPGDPASPEEAIEALINEYEYKDSILRTNAGGSGAGGNTNSTATKRQEAERLKAMNPTARLNELWK